MFKRVINLLKKNIFLNKRNGTFNLFNRFSVLMRASRLNTSLRIFIEGIEFLRSGFKKIESDFNSTHMILILWFFTIYWLVSVLILYFFYL